MQLPMSILASPVVETTSSEPCRPDKNGPRRGELARQAKLQRRRLTVIVEGSVAVFIPHWKTACSALLPLLMTHVTL